jgi:hypothetical protein
MVRVTGVLGRVTLRPVCAACLIALVWVIACGGPEEGGERGGYTGPDASSQEDAPAVQSDSGAEDAADAGSTDGVASDVVEAAKTCAETACHALATCDDSSGAAVCTCASGYTGDGIDDCSDIDECATSTDDCAAEATCTNTTGSFECACNTGFAGDGRACADVDECADSTANCHQNADCQNTQGSFSCSCKSGFTGDGIGCADIDECATNTDNCPVGTTCENADGSFVCRCAAGYEERNGVCVDKCVIAMAEVCDPVATCSIIANNAVCTCPSTHTDVSGNGSQCVVNASCTGACSDPNALCVVDSTTQVHCECRAGFTDVNGDGSVCQDVNECLAGTAGCNVNANCQNTVGGFTCECKSGFAGDGFTCTNINECAQNTDNCDPNATCADTSPGFTCTCKTGWQGTGQSCTDVDECALNTDDCHTNANCTNTQGGFTCACKPGFTGDGKTSCTDINECTLNTDNCNVNATCTNTPGSFTCACNLGYQGDGTTTCTNANECALNTDNCDPNATCTDKDPPERFSCACNFGYTGTGTTCTLDFCDLNGTWAVRTRTTISWANVTSSGFVVIQAGTFTADVWELRKITYDGQVVTNETKPCGATYPDAKNPTLNETYGAYIPTTRWDSLPFRAPFTDPVVKAKPGSAYVSSQRAELFGIRLTDPFGAWPTAATQVTNICNSTASNTPCWANDDNDNFTAITSWSKPPTQRSTIYNQNYSYTPAGVQLFITRRVACQHLGARSITRFNGSVVDCNTIKGPMEVTATNSRLHSCRVAAHNANDSDCFNNIDVSTRETLPNCTPSEAQELDQGLNDLQQTVTTASFAMVRIADGSNCAAVRGASYPPP